MATQVIRDPFGNISGMGGAPSYAAPTLGTGLYNYTDPFRSGGAAAAVPTEAARASARAMPYNVSLVESINAVNRAAQEAASAARLGPTGQEIKETALGNISRSAAGLLDPQTEAMLQSGIAQYGAASGMGVDSANLAAAYRRALGRTIEEQQAGAESRYLAMLAGEPVAPVFTDWSSMMYSPSAYAATAESEAKRMQDESQFQRDLAYRYAALGAGGAGRGGGYLPSGSMETTAPTQMAAPMLSAEPETYQAPFTTEDWWQSIGWTPPTSEAPTETGNSIFDLPIMTTGSTLNQYGLPEWDWVYGPPA